MVRLLAAIAALLTLAAAEHHHSPPPRQLRRSLSTSEPAEPPTPVHGYERLEVDAAFIPLAMASCTPSCTASLGALLSGVRADMSAAMAITPSRIHFGGVAASAGGTHVYFTVAAEAGGLATERTSAEAKIALSAATTASGAPMQLGGAAASKYTPSGDSLPCTYCLSLSESCAATAMAACANVVADGTAATCTGAGACSHTAADAAAPTAEACVASDQAACAAADLDGLAATCTAAGACTYSSSISNVTVTFLAVEEEHTSHAPLGVAFTFAMISLMLGTFVKTLLDLIPPGAYHPPYSVLIFALGMLCAQLDYSLNANGEISPEIHESVEYWLAVDPHVIMYGLLPPLLFESAFGVDFHVFVKVAAMSVIMALPGVIVATGCTAAVSMLFFSDCCHVQLWDCVLMGSILSATDPVAVVGVLNTLGAPAHLKHMIEGESLLNDGSAVVIFLIAQQMMDAENQLTGGEMLLKFLKLAGGGVLWGYVAGYIAFYWCKLSRHASVVDVAVLILCTYMVFYIGEHGFHVSGVLAAVTFGILFSRLAPHAMSEHVIHANHVVFSQICHFAETHIFVLAGLIIYARFFLSESHIDKSFHFPLGCAMYLAIHVIRGSVIAIFSPLLSRLGYGITLGEGIIMTYGGLRGAVSLAMALMLDADLSVDIVIRELIVFHTGVIVVLTIVINGMTAGALYNYLNMYPANAFRAELRERGFRVLAAEVESIYEVFKKDWFHQLADPATLKKVCPDFTKAKAKFGEIHVPDSDVEQIFFGFQGYVHKELYGWKRVGGRARQLVRHQSGSGMLAPPMTAQGDVSKSGRNLAVDHSAGQSAELSHTSTAPAKAPTQFKPGTKGGPSPNHEHELVPDLWIGGIPQYQANEACLRAIFEKLGEVRVIYFRNKPNDIGTNKPRSWAYITFGGNAEARALSVEKAKLAPIKVQRQDRSQDDVVLDVQDAEADKAASGSHATNIWDQMSKVSGNRAKQLKNSAISADNVEEAKMLMYEICFTAVNARYQEMLHHQLISIKTLDRLQEALKKGQDVLVQLRDSSADPSKLPNPIYLGWNDEEDHAGESAFRLSFSSMFGGDKDVRPESLKSIKNFVAAKNHHKEMSMSRFQHIEDLLLCAEMAWAVREAHHEVVYHVLHGEIVETDDEHILQARGHVAQEMRQVVRESERCLEGMHEEHWSMMRLVHTVIASRSTLHYILNKIEMLVHKGFFDERDKSSLDHMIGERMLQLEKAFDHGPAQLAFRELVRKCCHRQPMSVPHSGVSGILKGETRSKGHGGSFRHMGVVKEGEDDDADAGSEPIGGGGGGGGGGGISTPSDAPASPPGLLPGAATTAPGGRLEPMQSPSHLPPLQGVPKPPELTGAP